MKYSREYRISTVNKYTKCFSPIGYSATYKEAKKMARELLKISNSECGAKIDYIDDSKKYSTLIYM